MSPNGSLSLMELSLKLSMLLALASIQRKQTLLQRNINNEYLKKSHEEFVFILGMLSNKVDPIIPDISALDKNRTAIGWCAY